MTDSRLPSVSSSRRRRVHVLTAGMESPNGTAMLLPLLRYRHSLAEAGIELRLFRHPKPALCECDVLLLDSKLYNKRWETETEAIIEEIASYRARTRQVIYLDLMDSTGWVHVRALPHVTLYGKSQLLCDRSLYGRPYYGYRLYTDYYHQHYGAEDETPVWSEPVTDPALRERLVLSWNAGLGDYSWSGRYRRALYRHLPLPALLRAPRPVATPAVTRPRPVSCRIGTSYHRSSVSFQRQCLREALVGFLQTDRLSRWAYLRELRHSRVVLSPFGYGEICYRDFEVFLAGALLLKPSMAHLETWPPFWEAGQTYLAHDWSLEGIGALLQQILDRYQDYLDIAVQGQQRYEAYLSGPEAGSRFAAHLATLLDKAAAIASREQEACKLE